MRPPRTPRLLTTTQLLLLLAALRFVVHLLTNGQYGFHRDELAFIDDARTLAWGYVAYPPLTPFVGRIALALFGPSLVGIRAFAALAQSVGMVLTGLMARELGGGGRAQIVAALAAAIAPMSLIMGALFQYIAFDYLWWVLIAYGVVRLVKSNNPRWWLFVGAFIGIGMMTKSTMAVWVAALVAGTLLTPLRAQLRSRWLWAGAALSLLIFLPNLLWQLEHDFISLDFLNAVRARDVAIGRADGFLPLQLVVSANPFTLPLWLAGLYFYFGTNAGRPFRPLGWMYVVALLILLLMRGRFYYLAPAYPPLLAAGGVFWERRLAAASGAGARWGWRGTWATLTAGALLGGALMLPVAPVNSTLWNISSGLHDNFMEQLGWPELVATVAGIYNALPPADQAQTGILTGNYGEAGAINLFGPAHGLPQAISGSNSYWLHGYGDPPPATVIVLGMTRETVDRLFAACEPAGRVSNPYGVANEEALIHPDIFLCRQPRASWPEMWPALQTFG